MNIQQRVQDILNKFDVNLTVTEEKSTELAEVTLENGTVVYTDDEFVVGAEAYIINDEGERISVPAGDYELNDGRLLVIGEGGAIEEIKGAEEPAEEPVAEEAEAERVEQSADEPEATEEVSEEATEELEVEVEIEMEDEDEDKPSYVTRAEVEEMIKSAFEALKEEDKEEMSDVNPEAPKAEAEPEAEAEEAPEADPVAEELAAVKAELSEMKDEAVPMLKHATPTAQAESLDLSKLSLTERVAALHSKFSQK